MLCLAHAHTHTHTHCCSRIRSAILTQVSTEDTMKRARDSCSSVYRIPQPPGMHTDYSGNILCQCVHCIAERDDPSNTSVSDRFAKVYKFTVEEPAKTEPEEPPSVEYAEAEPDTDYDEPSSSVDWFYDVATLRWRMSSSFWFASLAWRG